MVSGIAARLIAARVFDLIRSDTGVGPGPLAWVGQEEE